VEGIYIFEGQLPIESLSFYVEGPPPEVEYFVGDVRISAYRGRSAPTRARRVSSPAWVGRAMHRRRVLPKNLRLKRYAHNLIGLRRAP